MKSKYYTFNVIHYLKLIYAEQKGQKEEKGVLYLLDKRAELGHGGLERS